jgi:hypothetical protein
MAYKYKFVIKKYNGQYHLLVYDNWRIVGTDERIKCWLIWLSHPSYNFCKVKIRGGTLSNEVGRGCLYLQGNQIWNDRLGKYKDVNYG